MNFTKGQRREIANTFTQARRHIENNEDAFICNALFTAYMWRTITGTECNAAKSIVRIRMGDEHTLESWLQEEAGVPTDLLTNENLRDYRLRWLNALIEEFSK